MIRAEEVTYEYEPYEEGGQTITAVRNLNLQIPRGSFTAILGRNGSGKSTLAKTFNGLLVPTGGKVLVADMDTADDLLVWEIRKKAGMVFQNPDNQIVAAMVEDDVAFGPENLGIAPEKIRQRIDAAMKSTGIYEQRKKAPSMLSGGQKQRVAIAGVIAMKPDCIIFDEPTAMLDPKGRADVMGIIRKLHEDGITIVLITHFMEEACQAQRIVIMEDGNILSQGTPEEIFARPEHILQAGLSIPPAVRMASLLKQRGVQVPDHILTMEALAAWIAGADCSAVTTPRAPEERSESSGLVRAPSQPPQTGGMKLTVEHLCHVYNPGRPDETKALEDVSFTIEPGSFTGIIGHTGSGKSTLIQHLNGLLKPSSGSITPEPDRQVRSRIGLVFQYPEYQLFEESVAKDVAFGPKNQGLKGEELEQRVREALDMVDLPCDTFGERSPFELSGGQKRRAAIAGVLAMRPEILILDEPTAGLDPKAHREILQLVKKIRSEWGCSIVLVSHNMDDVADLCDRVLVMDGGRLALQGTPQEVFLQADALCSMGLDLPSGGLLIRKMRDHGVLTIDDAISETDAADAVVKYLRGCCR